MLVPLLAFLFVTTVLGLILAVVRDSHRKGYPAGYRRGHPLPPQPVRQMAPRTPRRLPPLQQAPLGSRSAPPAERRPAVERPAAVTPPAADIPMPAAPRRPAAAASSEGAMRPAARTPAGEQPAPRRPAPQIPPAVAEGVTTAWERARYAASRVREGVAAAATSPQTKRAAQTSREALRSAATTSVETTRRLSVYTREQFDRDPRRAWMTATIIGGVLLVLVFVAIMLFSGGGSGSPKATGDQPTTSSRGPSTGTQAAGGAITTSTATGGSATPAAASAGAPLPGTPYSETVVLSTMQSRGLAPTLVNEAFTCQNAGTTPHTYRVTANGAEQRFVLLIYPDATATNKDWAIGAGRPQYRNGNCANDATVIYFNQNVLMVIPQATNPALRQQVVDAFLALP